MPPDDFEHGTSASLVACSHEDGPLNAIPHGRFVSLDAYRGFVMLAMVSGGLGIAGYARKHQPDSDFWNVLGYQLDHVHWGGCSFWDLIQPSFMFIVGVAKIGR